jgi:hypothetical protein
MESAMNSYFGTPPERTWQEIQPEAVVFSDGWPTDPERTRALMFYMHAENFGLQACYETPSFGHIELWAKNIPPDLNPVCATVCNPRTGC